MGYALLQAMRCAVTDGREPGASFTTLLGKPASPRPGEGATPAAAAMQRAAFVMVVMAATHSLLEYPLWYSYFLLPAASPRPLPGAARSARAGAAAADRGTVTRPLVLAPMLLMLAATLALYDYMMVVIIFAPRPTPRRSTSASPTASAASCSRTMPTTPRRPSPSIRARC